MFAALRGTATDLAARWNHRLATAEVPFVEPALPVGRTGTGRLVRVVVDAPSEASYAQRHEFIGHDLGLYGLPLAGHVELLDGRARVTLSTARWAFVMQASFLALFAAGGLHFLLASESVWDRGGGLLFLLFPVYGVLGVRRACRRIADDVVLILGMMCRGEGDSVFSQ